MENQGQLSIAQQQMKSIENMMKGVQKKTQQIIDPLTMMKKNNST